MVIGISQLESVIAVSQSVALLSKGSVGQCQQRPTVIGHWMAHCHCQNVRCTISGIQSWIAMNQKYCRGFILFLITGRIIIQAQFVDFIQKVIDKKRYLCIYGRKNIIPVKVEKQLFDSMEVNCDLNKLYILYVYVYEIVRIKWRYFGYF